VAALQAEEVKATGRLIVMTCTQQTENQLPISNLWTLPNNPSAHN